MNKQQLLLKVTGNEMVKSYLETALWATPLEGDESFKDRGFKIHHCSNDFLARALRDCEEYLQHAQGKGGSLADIGHDFFLSRNDYGVGFIDQKIPEEDAILLNLLARSMGVTELFLANGKVQRKKLTAAQQYPKHPTRSAVKHVQDQYCEILTGGLLQKAEKVARQVREIAASRPDLDHECDYRIKVSTSKQGRASVAINSNVLYVKTLNLAHILETKLRMGIPFTYEVVSETKVHILKSHRVDGMLSVEFDISYSISNDEALKLCQNLLFFTNFETIYG